MLLSNQDRKPEREVEIWVEKKGKREVFGKNNTMFKC